MDERSNELGLGWQRAVEEGLPVDVTAWANACDARFRLVELVAVSAAVWQDIHDIPNWAGWQKPARRAECILCLAASALRNLGSEADTTFQILLPFSTDPGPRQTPADAIRRFYRVVRGPDESGQRCVTIVRSEEKVAGPALTPD